MGIIPNHVSARQGRIQGGLMRRNAFFYVGAAILFLSTSGAPKAFRPQAPAQHHEVTVRRVLVDVIAVDGSGRVVDDLNREDVILKEDGRPGDIQSMEFIDMRRVRTGEAAARASARPLRFFVVIDSINTIRRMLDLRRAEITSKLTDLVLMGGQVMVAELNPERGVDILQPLTEDPDLIARGVEAATGSIWVDKAADGLLVPKILTGGDFNKSQAEIKTGRAGHNPVAESFRQIYEMESRARFEKTLGNLLTFMNLIKDRPGRKTVLYISGGLPALSFEKVFSGQGVEDQIVHQSEIAAAKLNDPFRVLGRNKRRHGSDIFEDLVRYANSHNITFYTFDPDDYLRHMLPHIADDNFLLETTRAAIKKNERAYLRYLAVDTDGVSLEGPSRFDRFQEYIRRDLDSCYELSYTPPRKKPDGKYHKLEVEVGRPGVRARFRRGYFDYTPEQSQSLVFAGASANPDLFQDFRFQARIVPFFTRRDTCRLWIMLALPVRGLILDENRDRESKLLKSHFWLNDPEKNKAFSARHDIPIVLTPEYRERLSRARFFGYNTCSGEVKLKSSAYNLTFAVHDPDTERTGTFEQDMSVLNPSDLEAPQIAAAVFGQVVGGGAGGRAFRIADRDGCLLFGDRRFHPMGSNSFGRNGPIHIFLQVFHPGKKPRLTAAFHMPGADGAEHAVPAEKVRDDWNGRAHILNTVYALDFSSCPAGEGRLTVFFREGNRDAATGTIPVRLF